MNSLGSRLVCVIPTVYPAVHPPTHLVDENSYKHSDRTYNDEYI